MTEDFYDLLEISPDASQEEIQQAFREQVRVYHPDLNDDDRARAQFTALKKAYDILADPAERQAYDRLGHEEYVAKRTKGLPSPDVWRTSTDQSTSHSNESTASTTSNTRTRSTRRTRTASTTETDGSGTAWTSSYRSAIADNAIVRWWRDGNFAWPLIWVSTLFYLAGLLQFVFENTTDLESLVEVLSSAEGDVIALWTLLSTGRYGVVSVETFITTAMPVPAALSVGQWYAFLAGLVGLSISSILVYRVRWRTDTWGAISIDETIVVAAAVAVSAMLAGGPLLAGSLLMPLLFSVIIHRTRQLPGWAPSLLYAIAVFGPAVGLVAGVVTTHDLSIATELVLFVLLPLGGSIGLLCRVNIRKRFGR